ncbi:unnamed protein product [Rhodiola kirilowii]
MPLNQPSPAAVCEGGTEGQVVAGEDMSKKIWKPYVISKSRESCTELEHEKFLEALHLKHELPICGRRCEHVRHGWCSIHHFTVRGRRKKRQPEGDAEGIDTGGWNISSPHYWATVVVYILWFSWPQFICVYTGAVLESKPQLVEIRDRVRSDVGGTLAAPSAQHQKGPVSPIQSEGKRVATAANPNPEDAADLLRMCLQCGIPKTFTTGKGMVYPVCNDRPPANPNKEAEKKKGSTIKDKEKNKRMKGHSSHASWKSETEMQLRQQFD